MSWIHPMVSLVHLGQAKTGPFDREIPSPAPIIDPGQNYRKFHALRLSLKKRNEYWKLDFNKDGFLAQDFTPHGAAVVFIDSKGRRRFPVWMGYQLQGGLGERLELVRKYTPSQFRGLLANPNSEAQVSPTRYNSKAQDWCLGDKCPPDYQFPPDWDVLGVLPPRKKKKERLRRVQCGQ